MQGEIVPTRGNGFSMAQITAYRQARRRAIGREAEQTERRGVVGPADELRERRRMVSAQMAEQIRERPVFDAPDEPPNAGGQVGAGLPSLAASAHVLRRPKHHYEYLGQMGGNTRFITYNTK